MVRRPRILPEPVGIDKLLAQFEQVEPARRLYALTRPMNGVGDCNRLAIRRNQMRRRAFQTTTIRPF
ncbi:MAG: hypothetical protein J2P48_03305 [Alphaproteobacteria bacterium]|nr:hypothetical protein [Alphaproteobacteria bacterium]